jgi:hypothetical protein
MEMNFPADLLLLLHASEITQDRVVILESKSAIKCALPRHDVDYQLVRERTQLTDGNCSAWQSKFTRSTTTALMLMMMMTKIARSCQNADTISVICCKLNVFAARRCMPCCCESHFRGTIMTSLSVHAATAAAQFRRPCRQILIPLANVYRSSAESNGSSSSRLNYVIGSDDDDDGENLLLLWFAHDSTSNDDDRK